MVKASFMIIVKSSTSLVVFGKSPGKIRSDRNCAKSKKIWLITNLRNKKGIVVKISRHDFIKAERNAYLDDVKVVCLRNSCGIH